VQYPNSFAVILLTAELLLITKERPRLWDYLCISVLLFVILYTGSRTVFVLAGLSNLLALLLNKNKKARWITIGCIGLGILLVLVYCLITDSFGVLARYLNISTVESTFVGRLLYARDALPVILRNPLGLGYMGYYFIQQSIQTGVYAVMFVHNDLLQMLLDVGWIPCALFITAVVMTLVNRDTPLRYKLILMTVLLHSCFDFDLQYIAIFMMLLLFMTPKAWKTKTLKKHPARSLTVTAVLLCLCLYFGTAQALTRFELHEAATALYKHNTVSDIEQLKETTDTAKAAEIADRILERNSHVAVAYSVKARAAYAKGDFAGVIEYKTKTIKTAPFSHVEYWEYGRMLVNGIKLYEQAGDQKSAEICRKELLSLSKALPAQKSRLSAYGASIDTQPKLYFPSDLEEQINALEDTT
jgi:tetratricopeptide (TPR) repeat protein